MVTSEKFDKIAVDSLVGWTVGYVGQNEDSWETIPWIFSCVKDLKVCCDAYQLVKCNSIGSLCPGLDVGWLQWWKSSEMFYGGLRKSKWLTTIGNNNPSKKNLTRVSLQDLYILARKLPFVLHFARSCKNVQESCRNLSMNIHDTAICMDASRHFKTQIYITL